MNNFENALAITLTLLVFFHFVITINQELTSNNLRGTEL